MIWCYVARIWRQPQSDTTNFSHFLDAYAYSKDAYTKATCKLVAFSNVLIPAAAKANTTKHSHQRLSMCVPS